jgi:hypothetical protein
MKTYEEMTLKELKEELRDLHDSIYRFGCYGTSDVRMYEATIAELAKRGYEVGEGLPVVRKLS